MDNKIDQFFDMNEMASLLSELEEKNKDIDLDGVMGEEMEASQRRVEEILEKHIQESGK